MPEGPAGGPRPFATSEIVIVFHARILESSTFDLVYDEESRTVIEGQIRDRTGLTVDVELIFTRTIIRTRRDTMTYEEIEQFIGEIREVMETLGMEIVSEIEVTVDDP
jgi:hypothetical protein